MGGASLSFRNVQGIAALTEGFADSDGIIDEVTWSPGWKGTIHPMSRTVRDSLFRVEKKGTPEVSLVRQGRARRHTTKRRQEQGEGS